MHPLPAHACPPLTKGAQAKLSSPLPTKPSTTTSPGLGELVGATVSQEALAAGCGLHPSAASTSSAASSACTRRDMSRRAATAQRAACAVSHMGMTSRRRQGQVGRGEMGGAACDASASGVRQALTAAADSSRSKGRLRARAKETQAAHGGGKRGKRRTERKTADACASLSPGTNSPGPHKRRRAPSPAAPGSALGKWRMRYRTATMMHQRRCSQSLCRRARGFALGPRTRPHLAT